VVVEAVEHLVEQVQEELVAEELVALTLLVQMELLIQAAAVEVVEDLMVEVMEEKE
tara:strand:+ start:357 stop:524 length:168 start_codon:yes stop_codon:yes gene_type:complete